jgi:hypothetical protein
MPVVQKELDNLGRLKVVKLVLNHRHIDSLVG